MGHNMFDPVFWCPGILESTVSSEQISKTIFNNVSNHTIGERVVDMYETAAYTIVVCGMR